MGILNMSLKKTALLVMNCQEGIVSSIGPQEREKILANVARVTKAARTASIPIIYIIVQFREGTLKSLRGTLYSKV